MNKSTQQPTLPARNLAGLLSLYGPLLGALVVLSLWLMPASAGGYESLKITAPLEDAVVHDNLGRIAVDVVVSPALDGKGGDQVELLLDGKVVAKDAKSHFALVNVDRGTHTLRARIMAADGTVVVQSGEVSFQMWRASRLFPSQQ